VAFFVATRAKRESTGEAFYAAPMRALESEVLRTLGSDPNEVEAARPLARCLAEQQGAQAYLRWPDPAEG
jgi:hypothetical protein